MGVSGETGDADLKVALQARLGYFRDLGIFDLYWRESVADPGQLQSNSQASDVPVQAAQSIGDASAELPADADADPSTRQRGATSDGLSSPVAPATSLPLLADGDGAASAGAPIPSFFAEDVLTEDLEDPEIAPRKAPLLPVVFTPGPLIAPAAHAQVLEALRLEIGDCTRCPLGFAGRHKVVFGDGDPNARLLFVGEGPGADEDLSGVPFVGKAGQLLNNMITAMGLARAEVYIANIVKCRPPKNRTPEPVEAVTCTQFLFRQIDIIRPEIIVALGSTAATYLLGAKSPLGALRGRLHAVHGARLIVTYHPAYLLRDPSKKKETWADLQIAMQELKASRSLR